MNADKKIFLQTFNDFLDSFPNNNYGKCYFELLSGEQYQGWISEIYEDSFKYLDSGPLSRKEPYIFEISNINVDTFAYWDEEIKKWTEYFGHDKFENRNKLRNNKPTT